MKNNCWTKNPGDKVIGSTNLFQQNALRVVHHVIVLKHASTLWFVSWTLYIIVILKWVLCFGIENHVFTDHWDVKCYYHATEPKNQQYKAGMGCAHQADAAITDNQEVLFDIDRWTAEEFTVEQLLQKQKKTEKATQPQQTFTVKYLRFFNFTSRCSLLVLKFAQQKKH